MLCGSFEMPAPSGDFFKGFKAAKLNKQKQKKGKPKKTYLKDRNF